jgi:hypothetical protein
MEPVTLLGRGLPPGVERAVHVIGAGRTLRCADDPWRTALAVVEQGEVELVTAGGARLRLATGAVFTLARLGPAVLGNAGPGRAVVVTARAAPPATAATGRPAGGTVARALPAAPAVTPRRSPSAEPGPSGSPGRPGCPST